MVLLKTWSHDLAGLWIAAVRTVSAAAEKDGSINASFTE